MKKLIIVSISILLFIAAIIICLNYFAGENEKKHYEKIEDKAKEAVNWYIKASNTIDIENDSPKEYFTPFSFLISHGYLKQEDLLDINNINTCDGYTVYTIYNHEVTCMNIFIKCKNYQTDNYENNNIEGFKCEN